MKEILERGIQEKGNPGNGESRKRGIQETGKGRFRKKGESRKREKGDSGKRGNPGKGKEGGKGVIFPRRPGNVASWKDPYDFSFFRIKVDSIIWFYLSNNGIYCGL